MPAAFAQGRVASSHADDAEGGDALDRPNVLPELSVLLGRHCRKEAREWNAS